jgi:signal transduction histidine kinase
MALLIIALLYSIHRYRVKRILELERLRIRIASDLHDDIGSALTRIAIHSEQLQSGKNPEKVSKTSKKIGALSRSVISTMSDIVWSIDARNDSWGNMLDRMKDVVYNTLLLKEINAIFDIKGIDHSHKIPLKYRQNIFYIFKEAVTNIVKHSDATEVRIVMHKTPHLFEMEIADNGNGFDSKDVRYGNGLRNMKMRAENIGGILDILTETGVKIKLKVKGI